MLGRHNNFAIVGMIVECGGGCNAMHRNSMSVYCTPLLYHSNTFSMFWLGLKVNPTLPCTTYQSAACGIKNRPQPGLDVCTHPPLTHHSAVPFGHLWIVAIIAVFFIAWCLPPSPSCPRCPADRSRCCHDRQSSSYDWNRSLGTLADHHSTILCPPSS